MKRTIALKAVFAVLLSIAASQVQAQDALMPMTLNVAIKEAVANSPKLQMANAKQREAAANHQEARDARLPDANISGSYLRLLQPDVNLQLKLSAPSNNGTPTEARATPDVQQAAYGIANVTLPIYAGGRIKLAAQATDHLAKAAKLDADASKNEVVVNAVVAYANAYKAKGALGLVKENLKSAEKREADFANLEKNGLLARNDFLKAQLQTSNIRITLLEATSNYKTAVAVLNLLTGHPADANIDLAAPAMENANANLNSNLQETALQSRPDLAAFGERRAAAETNQRISRTGYFPTLALTGGYIAADIPNVITITNAANIGIALKYNISSFWKGRSSISRADAQQDQIIAGTRQLTDAIILETQSAQLAFSLSEDKVKLYQQAVDQATENNRITNNKYDASLATITEVLDADVALLQTKLNLNYGNADVIIAHYKLMQSAGAIPQF